MTQISKVTIEIAIPLSADIDMVIHLIIKALEERYSQSEIWLRKVTIERGYVSE